MANNVTVQLLGGESKVVNGVDTVADCAKQIGATEGYTAAINGESAEMSELVDDYNNVTFSKASKGGI